MASKYRAVLFDVYGTLLDVSGVVRAVELAFPGQGPAMSQNWRRKQLEYSWLRALARRHADFWQVTGDALDYVAEDMKLVLSSPKRAALMDAYKELPAFDGAAATLAGLRDKGILRAALSNGSPEMLEPALTAAGLRPLLDDILSVETCGHFKVAPQAYQMALDRFGGSAGDFLLVSSNGWDAAGAAFFGFDTFWINRTGAPIERLGVSPTAVGERLEDLFTWLG